MITLHFTKRFIKGNLKGIKIDDKLPFVSVERAIVWINAILKKEQEKKLDYYLVQYHIKK